MQPHRRPTTVCSNHPSLVTTHSSSISHIWAFVIHLDCSKFTPKAPLSSRLTAAFSGSLEHLWCIIHAQITAFMMNNTCSDHCVYDAWYMLRSLRLWCMIHAHITAFMMNDTCSDHCVYDKWYMLRSLLSQPTAAFSDNLERLHFIWFAASLLPKRPSRQDSQRHHLTSFRVYDLLSLQQIFAQNHLFLTTHSGIISQAFVVQTCSKFIQNLLQTWLAVATYLWCVKMRMPPQTKSGRNLR